MRLARAETSSVFILAAAVRKGMGWNLPEALRTKPPLRERSPGVAPRAGAMLTRNFCAACQAASRTAGVREAVVTLPPELGPTRSEEHTSELQSRQYLV